MLHYVPTTERSWLALATSDRVLLVEAGAATSPDRLWTQLAVDGTQGVLDELTASGLGATPSFALVSWTAGDAPDTLALLCIVRGAASLGIETPAGAVVIDGSTASTWVERSVAAASRFTLTAPVDAAGTPLPLGSGVAWSAALTVVADGTVLPPIAPEPAPATAPAAPVLEELDDHTVVMPNRAAAKKALPLDDLDDRTVVRPRVTPANGNHVAPIVEEDLDHDGATIVVADRAQLRSRRTAATAPVAPAAPKGPRYSLVFSTGFTEHLEIPIVVGRAPSVMPGGAGESPLLVPIPGDEDISRNHARFAVEGDSVVVTDLHSRNGTSIAIPGRPPQRLRQGEPTTVLVGTVVDLGGGITITVRER